jgi:hypothetical protein
MTKWVVAVLVVLGVLAAWLLIRDRGSVVDGPGVDPFLDAAAKDATETRRLPRISPKPASAGVPDDDPSGSRAISGLVVSEAGAPVVGAALQAYDSRRPWTSRLGPGEASLASTTAGADGRFELLMPAGVDTVSLFASEPRFAATIRRGVLVGSLDVLVIMKPGVRLSGRVLDTSRRPVSGAEIAWRPILSIGDTPHGRHTATTAGAYSIDGLPEGVYLDVRAVGHPDRLIEVIDLHEDRELDLILGDGVTVRGRVIGESTGAPLPAARVEAWRCEGLVAQRDVTLRRIARLAATVGRPDGTFELTDLPVPSPDLPMAFGESHVGLWVVHEAAAPAYVRLGLARSKTMDVGDVALFGRGGIRGRVVDRSGRPLPNLGLLLTTPQQGLLRSLTPTNLSPTDWRRFEEFPAASRLTVETNAEGIYEFGDVPVPHVGGQATVRVLPRVSQGWSVKVATAPGRTVTAPDLIVDADPNARFFGKTVDGRDETPLGRVRIDVDEDTSVVTRSDGTFEFPLFPGPVMPGGSGLSIKSGFVPKRFSLSAVTSAESRAVIAMTPAKSIGGRLLDSAGAPVAGAYVRVVDGRVRLGDVLGHRGLGAHPSQHALVRTNAEGRFAASALPGGPYHVIAEVPRPKPPYRRAVASGIQDGADSVTLRLADPVAEGGPGRHVMRVVSARTGTVIPLEGPPRVAGSNGTSQELRFVGSGTYELEGFTGATVELSLRPINRPPVGRRQPIPDGDFEIVLPDVLSIQGHVSGAGSIEDARFEAVDEARMEVVATATVKDGRIEVFDLPPGRYLLRVAAPSSLRLTSTTPVTAVVGDRPVNVSLIVAKD